uniref:Uncharacterized protein n=1 Tax=Anguilla anguilla TaxID=7936 RepID=A0A0E9RSI9_ANGAN
MRDGYCRV